MLDLDWVQIPEGEFIFGLSIQQRDTLRKSIWQEYGLDKLDVKTRLITESLIEKYRRWAKDKTYSLSNNLTVDEAFVRPKFDDSREWYFLADAELEHIPQQQQMWLPTFYISRFPITHTQANLFYDDISITDKIAKKRILSRGLVRPNTPEQMSWETAQAMAQWLGCRLPTVYEWEKAARGTDGRLYLWGNEWFNEKAPSSHQSRSHNSRRRKSTAMTPSVRSDDVSPYDIRNMVGNLSEWTETRELPRQESEGAQPLAKGLAAKQWAPPYWFWSILPRQHFGGSTGMRPIRHS